VRWAQQTRPNAGPEQYGALHATDVKQLRSLQRENDRLKKTLAERDLAIEVMKEINRKK